MITYNSAPGASHWMNRTIEYNENIINDILRTGRNTGKAAYGDSGIPRVAYQPDSNSNPSRSLPPANINGTASWQAECSCLRLLRSPGCRQAGSRSHGRSVLLSMILMRFPRGRRTGRHRVFPSKRRRITANGFRKRQGVSTDCRKRRRWRS